MSCLPILRLSRWPFAALAAVSVLCQLTPAAAQARISQEKVRQFAAETLAPLLEDPALIAAVREQNAANANLRQDEILALDERWRNGERGLQDAVMSTPLSRRMGALPRQTGGTVTEVIIMDRSGLNVALSGLTSDYWQGDEAKWQETFLRGAGALHVSDVEEDESTQIFQVQISLPVLDGDEVIGAATFGVDADEVEE